MKDSHLLVLIITSPVNLDRRDAIRRTWIADAVERDNLGSFLTFRFVVGVKNLKKDVHEQLINEQGKNHDLLMLDELVDRYESLSMKLGLMVEHVHDKGQYFDFLLKVDDDSYVRVKEVWDEIRRDDSTRMLYWGYFYGRGRVKTKGLWKEPNWKLCDYYLPYARGGGYVISREVVKYLALNWRLFQQYQSEDVTLGAWLAPLAVERRHDVRFDTEYKTRGCSNTYIVSHKQSIDDMFAKSKSLRITGKLCDRQVNLFPGYQYDWSVPPSQCCTRKKGIF